MVNNKNYNLKILNGIITNGSYPFSTEWAAIINRANTLGYTVPSLTTQISCDILIQEMKASGFWNLNDTIFNFSYNNTGLTQFSLIDWKNPTRVASTIGGMTYSNSGWKGDAVSAYIDTNYNPTGSTNWALNNASWGGVVYDPIGQYFLGHGAGTTNRTVFPIASAGVCRIQTTNVPSNPPNYLGIGYKYMARTGGGSSTTGEFTNGATDGSINWVNIGTSIDNATFTINRIPGGTYASNGVSMIHVGRGSITSTMRQSLRTSFNKYLTRIGLTAFA